MRILHEKRAEVSEVFALSEWGEPTFLCSQLEVFSCVDQQETIHNPCRIEIAQVYVYLRLGGGGGGTLRRFGEACADF
jgi:hypothetical protein